MTTPDTLTVKIEADTSLLRSELEKIKQILHSAALSIAASLSQAEAAVSNLSGTLGDTEDNLYKGSKAAEVSLTLLKEAVKKVEGAFAEFFEGAILDGKKISDVLKGLGKDLAELALRRAVAEPLAKYLGDLAQGTLAPLGASIGGALGGFFGGVRAEGGAVSAGRAYLVGERGPELFVPPAAGEIVPNNVLGGDTVNLYQTINIAPDVSAVARAEIARALPMIRNYAAQGITDGRLRGALPA